MAAPSETHPLAIVTACMNRNGTATFARTEVAVTQEEDDNGMQYHLAEKQLLAAGYEEPMVHFDEDEAAAFLHPAVRRHLGLSPAVSDPIPAHIVEES